MELDVPVGIDVAQPPVVEHKIIWTLAEDLVADPEIDRRVKRALGLQTTDQYRAAQAFAAIDRDLVDLAPLIPYATGEYLSFVSERVGNAEGNPQLGVLLSQMWIR